VRTEADEGLYIAGQLWVVGHSRVAVHLGAVALPSDGRRAQPLGSDHGRPWGPAA
jgi:hypothetical protein